MKLEISRHIFEKSSNIKFHENPSSGSRVVPCGQTDRQTGITKLTVAVRNFVNVPKKIHITILPLGTYTYINASLQITLQDTIARTMRPFPYERHIVRYALLSRSACCSSPLR